METKHSIVRKFIKNKILDGTYLPNTKINSESELMERFSVSRHTVRIAIGDLVNRGWLYRKQGAGTFCADTNDSTAIKYDQKNIAIITTHISDYIFPSIIHGAESILSRNDYQVSLFSTDNKHEIEKQILERIPFNNVSGIIIEPTLSMVSNPNLNYYLILEKYNIPYVMINAYYDELEPLSITINDEKGGYIQTEHLISLGHQNILGFFKNDDLQGTKRMKGYLKAHRFHSITINPTNIITYNTQEKTIKPKKELERILDRPNTELPSAIVCYNDELAMSLLEVLRNKQIKVPEDISLIGYDDSAFSKVSEVKLTTIKHPQRKMGEDAAKMILGLLNEETFRNKKLAESIVYEPQLIKRNSTLQMGEKIEE